MVVRPRSQNPWQLASPRSSVAAGGRGASAVGVDESGALVPVAFRNRRLTLENILGSRSTRQGGSAVPHKCLHSNIKRYLINYPHLFDYGQTIFCLSFPSRDRATAPGRYEQFYFTEHVPYPQKIHFEDTIRSEDPVQLFCNSFCVQHKMVGDDYPSILQCLVYCHSAN